MTEFFRVWHYDGQTATRRRPDMEVVGSSFLLSEGGWRSGPFAFADLRWQGQQGDARIYGLDGHDGWRLGL